MQNVWNLQNEIDCKQKRFVSMPHNEVACERQQKRNNSLTTIFKVKFKVIKTSMGIYAMHKPTGMPSLNVITNSLNIVQNTAS